MLQRAIDAVQEFHAAKGIDFKQELVPAPYASTEAHTTAGIMRDAAERLLRMHADNNDRRLLRMHLILEEVSELIDGINCGDELETLDGMADAIVVICGTAVTFDLPLSEAFEEVHRSNMTKKPKTGPRLRDKGDDYSPPDLEHILKEHRCTRH